MATRPLSEIATEIRKEWKKVNFGAVPYLNAMETLTSVKENFHYDSGESIVIYFLANASGFRGEAARRIKADLKSALKGG